MNKKNNTFLGGLASRLSALVLLLVVGTVSAMALGTNKLEVSDLVIKPGEIKTVSVSLTNDDPVSAIQLDVKLPDGLTYVRGTLKLSSERTSDQKHYVSCNKDEDNYGVDDLRILLLTRMTVNPDKSALGGNEGEILTFDVKAVNNFVPGEILFHNIVGTDGTVSKPYEIRMADVTVNAYPQIGLLTVAQQDMSLKPGDEALVDVVLKNDVNIAGLQAEFTLPEGISLVTDDVTGHYAVVRTDRLTNNMEVEIRDPYTDEPNRYRVVLASLTNDAIKGTDGVIFSIKIKADDDFAVAGQIVFDDVLVAMPNSSDYVVYASDEENVYPVVTVNPYIDFEYLSVAPVNDEAVESLSELTLDMNVDVTGIAEGAKANVYRNGDKISEGTLTVVSGDVKVVLAAEINEYGTYTVEIPAGALLVGGISNDKALTVDYQVGILRPVGDTQPSQEDVQDNLKEVTVFMNAKVGGLLDGAVLDVTRNGDKVGEATLAESGVEPYPFSNEVKVVLTNEISDYGTYVIEVPAGVIFDEYYNGEDAVFSGARANEAFTLTYNVKTLQAAGTYPSMDEVQESLKDITVTMNARVGGVLEGNKLDVTRNGDKVAEATVAEGMEPNSNEVIISLDREISDYGTYVIEVPQGVIFDDNYNGEDAAFSGARSNDAFTLTYNVGTMQYASAYPSTETAVETLKEITVFMNTRVGGILDGAEFDVKKDGEVVTTAALAEGMEPNSNEVLLTLADEITEYGTYTIEVPGNVIFDDNYNGEDAVFSGARGNDAFALTYNVGVFEVASVTPEDGATLESLSEIKLKMTATVGGILDGATLTVKRNGEDAVPATLSVSEDDATEVVVTLAAEQAEYGLYTIEIPAGTIFDENYDELDPMMSGARSNDLIALSYHVGEFNVVNVDPLPGTPLDNLTQVTVFMSAPVGGFLEGAAVDVMKNGDKVAEAVLDWATEIGGNDVAVILPHAVAEYGTYTIVVPAGVIFDVNYSGDDAAFSGAQGNEAFELTYKVGEFEVADIVPAPGEEPVESLKNIEIFMNARVGGFLDGAKVNVLKNGDVVAEGTLDWATEPYGNDVVVRLNTELTEYGTYTVEIPAGVIFDENYVAEDPAMSGASSNDVLTLVYQVGKFELVSTTPVQTEAQPSLKDIELFMSARVGGFDEGATVTVTRNGSEITTGTLDWATEPLGNDIVIRLADEITEFGVYEIVIPAGTIYDENYESYDEVDPFFSGAKSNEEIKLTYTIGLSLGDFVPVSISPSLNSTVESLGEIEIEMSSEVGGFLIGSPVVVTNEEGVEVARGSFEWAEDTNGAELVIRLDKVIEEAGTYEVAVPAGVIYDESYNENDPFMPGVKHNEAFTLTYTVSGASSIDGVKLNIDSNDKVYNLNGVRVNGPIGKGLYIINGKKVVNKR